jgi:hypothetical protein
MGETAIADLADYRELMVTVSNNSTIRVRKMRYSVPGRLIGAKLLARVYENRIVLLDGAREVAQLPLCRGDRGAVIDFRHVIGHLLRKPGAFAGYRWREEMFPGAGLSDGPRSSGAHQPRGGPALSGDPQGGGR